MTNMNKYQVDSRAVELSPDSTAAIGALLNRHSKVRVTFVCPECGKELKSVADLMEHYLVTHQGFELGDPRVTTYTMECIMHTLGLPGGQTTAEEFPPPPVKLRFSDGTVYTTTTIKPVDEVQRELKSRNLNDSKFIEPGDFVFTLDNQVRGKQKLPFLATPPFSRSTALESAIVALYALFWLYEGSRSNYTVTVGAALALAAFALFTYVKGKTYSSTIAAYGALIMLALTAWNVM